MSLKQRLMNQLEQLVAKGPQHVDAVTPSTSEQGYLIGLPSEDGVGVSLSLADYDRYSITLQHLEVYNKSVTIEEADEENYLNQVAAEISQRLTYLEEPLALIELSTTDGLAQLRSSPPEHSRDESTYWEVTVRTKPHPQTRIARYRWVAGNRQRTTVIYPATFAPLGRMAQDLAASLSTVAEKAA